MAKLAKAALEFPTQGEATDARRVGERLAESVLQGGKGVTLVLDDEPETPIAIPPFAVRLLAQGLAEIAKGKAVRMIPLETELSTQEAAELLNLSRPYVVRMLDEGKIPSFKVGTHRRVRLEDLLAYKASSEADRLEALKNLVAEAQELDMGY
jgi:excisionase family DNA binding protein